MTAGNAGVPNTRGFGVVGSRAEGDQEPGMGVTSQTGADGRSKLTAYEHEQG